MDILKERKWWGYLEEDLQELLTTAFLLDKNVRNWNQQFHDYSFVVFPAAKAYEGFLKKLFLDLNFINEDQYRGKRFRVGKSLNPQLERRYKKESVYIKIVKYCGGKNLADNLWLTWKECRNILFHWFPDEKNAIDKNEASQKLLRIVDSIDQAFKECKVK